MKPVIVKLRARRKQPYAPEWAIKIEGQDKLSNPWFPYHSIGELLSLIADKMEYDETKEFHIQLSNAMFDGAKLRLQHTGYEYLGDVPEACTFRAHWLNQKDRPANSGLYPEVWICLLFLAAVGFNSLDPDLTEGFKLWVSYSLEDRDEAVNVEPESQEAPASE